MTKSTWALVISTYNRHEILQKCLGCALDQTRPPSEVIIVDASSDWTSGRELTLRNHAGRLAAVRFRYEPAEVAASSAQRNQGVDLATSDALFVIDDDSLMHPDCAEKILEVYETDTTSAVAGVQANVVSTAPSNVRLDVAAKRTGHDFWGWLRGHPLVESVYSRWLLMNRDELFLPYLGGYPQHSIPEPIQELDVAPLATFMGAAMTFRREVIQAVRFDDTLRSYSASEDVDASYRASLRGALLLAMNARLYHAEVAAGRTNRFVASALGATNQAFLLRRHSTNLQRDRGRYRRLMIRRLFAEFIKDGLSGRWTFPQLRAMAYGLGIGETIFRVPERELLDTYQRIQVNLLAKR